MNHLDSSELIINPDGSIYHLHLRPDQIADTIITVGDPDRVEKVSRLFDSVTTRVQHREFKTHTGILNNKPLTVISTGIGTDNIDIVLNELDALVNIDFVTRRVRNELRSLQIVRLGTSGSLQTDIPVDTVLVSQAAIGIDGLLNFYKQHSDIQETVWLGAFNSHFKNSLPGVAPYLATASEKLLNLFSSYQKGVTVTANGFYAPQGRRLRLQNEVNDLQAAFSKFHHPHFRLTNLEMETAAIYALGKLMGHHCISVNAILANRFSHTFSTNPAQVVERMIDEVLELITTKN